VAPTEDVLVVVEDRDVRQLDAFHWGLVPAWAKDVSVGNRMINARAEGIADKAAFKRAFGKRRCLIPADGFYEWSKVPGHRKKQPYFIHRPDGEPFAFAGLWALWRERDEDGNELEGRGADGHHHWLRSCAIITTEANQVMAPLHDRMPVVLAPSAWEAWLDPANEDLDGLARLLVPAPDHLVAYHAVSTDVSNVRNQGEHLIEPVAEIDPDGKAASRHGQASLLDGLGDGTGAAG
jgi:putative SOS response-associated peptidase YedK